MPPGWDGRCRNSQDVQNSGTPQASYQDGLAFADDPGYAADFLDALDRWHSYLTGWILPRIFSVAEGNRPPVIILNAA
jgi:hypothetical protein